MVVLVDARYYGERLRQARNSLRMSTMYAAHILKISHAQLLRYERGREVFPEQMIHSMLCHSLSTLRVKHELHKKLKKK